MHIGYWWGSQKVSDHWEDRRRWWVDNIKMDLREMGWIGLIWLRIGTSGGLL
jgi:hypothetical protein